MSATRTSRFELVWVVALRAAQLRQGCTPHVPEGHNVVVTARREVEAGKVRALPYGINGPHTY